VSLALDTPLGPYEITAQIGVIGGNGMRLTRGRPQCRAPGRSGSFGGIRI
jgi:hypothetical protein